MWRILCTLLAAATLMAMIANTLRIDAIQADARHEKEQQLVTVESTVDETESLMLEFTTAWSSKKFPKKAFLLRVRLPQPDDVKVNGFEILRINNDDNDTDNKIFMLQAGGVVVFIYRPGHNKLYRAYARGGGPLLQIKPMDDKETAKFAPPGLTREGELMTVIGLPNLYYLNTDPNN